MKTKARILLKDIFGYDEFRPFQEDIIHSVLEKNDTLAIMPTGGGKSICYQIPATIFDGLTLVISPLISLMKDQVDQLKEYKIPAVMLNSSLGLEEYHENFSLVKNGWAKLLYLAPESLIKNDIVNLLSSLKIDCIAIDEAHCISEWGHDFRPEYRQLADFRARFPGAACIATTATATERVRKDISASLRFRDPKIYIASFNRSNLLFQVTPKQHTFIQLMEFLKKFPGQSGIIYCFSRNGVDDIARRLKSYGYSVLPYHAGLQDSDRKINQELFIRDEVQIVVATIAFGMGIHKSNIRFVVHYDLPKSLESYYQETGRAGRDGLMAHCLLLYSYSDVRKIKYFIDQKEDPKDRASAETHLRALINYAENNSCRRVPLLEYFGEKYGNAHCGMCDNCLTPPSFKDDITKEARMFLSCIKRVNEKFGMTHIVDVLRGSESQKITGFGHHKISTYGIGRDYSKKQWMHIARQFIRNGLVIQDEDNYGILKITESGYEAMLGKIQIKGAFIEDKPDAYDGKDNGESGYDSGLFEILRKERKRLADEGGVPPYVVFSDKTLAEMAAYYPHHRSTMLDMHGVGINKYDTYGEIFIKLITDHCKSRGICEKIKQGITKRKTGQIYKYKKIGDLYNEGLSISEIMKTEGTKLQTILAHLYDYILNGYAIKPDGLAPYMTLQAGDEKIIMEAFDKTGTERMRPFYDLFEGKIDYATLNVYRLKFLCGQGNDDITPRTAPRHCPG